MDTLARLRLASARYFWICGGFSHLYVAVFYISELCWGPDVLTFGF